jgi:hypothetical protein
MKYYIKLLSQLEYNTQYNAYSGTISGCDFDIVGDSGGIWECEIICDGEIVTGIGGSPQDALKAAINA